MVLQRITSITAGPRQSNFELLRILAMFLVLVVHSDFWSIGAPSVDEYQTATLTSVIRSVIQCVSIICVNVFVCISGWFGIKASLKGITTFLFQCVFIVSITYIFALLTGICHFSLTGIRQCLLLDSSLWFVKAYIGLYILSPVLNSFSDSASCRQFVQVLVPFYIFQTLFGIAGAAPYILNGYSVFSFAGLYLLAKFVRKYCLHYKKQIILGGGVFRCCSMQ